MRGCEVGRLRNSDDIIAFRGYGEIEGILCYWGVDGCIAM